MCIRDSPYTVWVIDEFKVDLDTVIELPMARWDVEYVALSMFQVLRCRSIGNVQCNIAWHMCLRAQASGADVIRLFRNAVMGQPAVEVVEASMKYEPGAGSPQNVFAQLKFEMWIRDSLCTRQTWILGRSPVPDATAGGGRRYLSQRRAPAYVAPVRQRSQHRRLHHQVQKNPAPH